ncbi:hypothetical protein H5410_042907 [Solanum commersonii]|uniref:Uncharacterized protein n=1 Tax=Solanum commersonii TaxID=4109 RepID=A0A9J5XW15_SOLCO|nr:hypothetical protein H5410_042907 [Solanum commersonii]
MSDQLNPIGQLKRQQTSATTNNPIKSKYNSFAEPLFFHCLQNPSPKPPGHAMEYFFNEPDDFMEKASKKCFKTQLYVVTNLVKETFRDGMQEK